ncbi:MAG TPA: UbiA family prenyltransferase [Bryobacteraceae bacterium]|nr:UbiA family prenyltransferase [Bryobacteraceae bacterium]HXJ43006.1 UbiA family prenyltransferase [Bryobacteraceae bacterium]
MPPAQGTAIAANRRPVRSFLHLLSCVRLDEVLVLQGTPLLGALFSMGTLTGAKCLKLLVFAAASSFLVAHVFVLNDWCGASTDLRDPNRTTRVFTARGIGRNEIRYLCATLLALTLLLLVPFGSAPLLIALALALLSALYSVPEFSMKGVPLLSSALHLLGGLLHFLLGYSIFRAPDWRGIEIGSFFALTFVAGHLTQEARDHKSDLYNRIRTNAVRFGPAPCFAAAFLLFTVADVLLFVLAQRGVLPRVLVLAAGFYPLHLWWTLQTMSAGLTFENIRRLQVRYRILYAVMGLIMIAALLEF